MKTTPLKRLSKVKLVRSSLSSHLARHIPTPCFWNSGRVCSVVGERVKVSWGYWSGWFDTDALESA